MYRSMEASYSSLEMQWLFRTIKRVIFKREQHVFPNNNLVEKRIRSVWQAFLEGLRTLPFCLFVLVNIPNVMSRAHFPLNYVTS